MVVNPACSSALPSVAQYSIWLATDRRIGWAASRAWLTSETGNLTDAKSLAGIAFSCLAHFAPNRLGPSN
jgi:hypothetical protein